MRISKKGVKGVNVMNDMGNKFKVIKIACTALLALALVFFLVYGILKPRYINQEANQLTEYTTPVLEITDTQGAKHYEILEEGKQYRILKFKEMKIND